MMIAMIRMFCLTILFLLVASCEENMEEDTWRPTEDVRLNCPWLSQQLYEDSQPNSDCGPVSLIMAAACVDGRLPVRNDELFSIIEWLDMNVDGYDSRGEGTGTNPRTISKVAGYLYGLMTNTFFDSLTVREMYENLQWGMPIIVSVRSQQGNATDIMRSNGGSHFVLLVGMTPTHVVIHDPLPWDINLGRDREYTIESFLSTWQEQGVRFHHRQ